MIAAACLASGLPPSAFLEHPSIGLEMIAMLDEEARERKAASLRDRLRAAVKG